MICKKCGKDTENNSVLCTDCTKQLKDSIAKITDEIKKAENNAELYIIKANCYKEFKQYHKALASYNKAIELEPNNAKFYFKRGNFRINNSLSYEIESLEDYNKAIELEPNNADFYYAKGIYYIYENDYCSAIDNFSMAIKLNPNYAKAYAERGYCYCKIDYYEEAQKDFNKAIKLEPDNLEVYKEKGELCYMGIPYYEVKAIEKYLKRNPDDINGYKAEMDFIEELNNSGVLIGYSKGEEEKDYNYREKRLEEDAQNIFRLTYAEHNIDINSMFDKIEFFEDLQKYSCVINLYTKIIDIGEAFTNPKSRENVYLKEAYLGRGNAYFEQKNYKKALSDFEKYKEFKTIDENIKYDIEFAKILSEA